MAVTDVVSRCLQWQQGEDPAEHALLMQVRETVETVVREFDDDVTLFQTQQAAD